MHVYHDSKNDNCVNNNYNKPIANAHSNTNINDDCTIKNVNKKLTNSKTNLNSNSEYSLANNETNENSDIKLKDSRSLANDAKIVNTKNGVNSNKPNPNSNNNRVKTDRFLQIPSTSEKIRRSSLPNEKERFSPNLSPRKIFQYIKVSLNLTLYT